MTQLVRDQFERPLKDLRLSVTDRCNFRCRYCMPEEIFGPDFKFLTKDKILSFEETERLAKIFVSLGVRKIRITGGEPLMRKDLPVLIEKLNRIEGVEDIAVTTNGSMLKPMAQDLAAAGLNRVTISLDSLDEHRFRELNGNRGKVKRVQEGIQAAADAGMRIKINMVVQKGKNEQDILPMARYFKEQGHILRFIEYMDVGNTNGWKMDEVVTKNEILDRIHAEMPLEPVDPNYVGEVATRYQYEDGGGEIGLITSVTDSFCANCSRARVSAEGKLYTCLFASEGYDLRSLLRSDSSDQRIQETLHDIWNHRKDRYSDDRAENIENHAPARKKVEMSHIGG